MTNSAPFGFELWTEDGLLASEQPDLFVDLTTHPIVFTVRGIAHFAPRFKHVGVDISALRTADDFLSARRRWDEVEELLLQERVTQRAASGDREAKALEAVFAADMDSFERHIRALEHRKRANLRIVR